MPAQGFVILTLTFRQEGKTWVGVCDQLGTSTYGRSINKVHDELKELVALHLNSLEQVGERPRFFEEHGIRFYDDGDEDSVTEIKMPLPVDDESFVHAHRVSISA